MQSRVGRIWLAVLPAVLLMGSVAQAQVLPGLATNERSLGSRVRQAPGPIATAVTDAPSLQSAAIRTGGGGQKGAAIGALVGAGVAAGITYWAASDYGNNEGGRFCTGCFVQWGAVTIPAGALVGAIVGHFVGGSLSAPQQGPRRPEAWLAPAIGRHGGGAVLSIRY